MRRFFLGLFLLHSFIFSSFIEENTGWSYIQSPNQSFYIFISPMDIVDAEGNTIEGYGDGSNGQSSETSDCGLDPSSCDVLGAFVANDLDTDGVPFNEGTCGDIGGYYQNNQCDVCVGWSYYNSYQGDLTTTLTMIGYATSDSGDYDYYAQNGDIPQLKYYDASDGIIYSLTSDIELGSFLNNNIFLYWPDCTGMENCLEVHFLATEDDGSGDDDENPEPGNFLWVSNVDNYTSGEVKITIDYNFEDVVSGFQLNLLSDNILSLIDVVNGEDIPNDFMLSTGAMGTILGFSFTGSTITGTGTLMNIYASYDQSNIGENTTIYAIEDCDSDGNPACDSDDTRMILSAPDASQLESEFHPSCWTIGTDDFFHGFCEESSDDGGADPDFPGFVNNETNWFYTQTTQQCFYMFEGIIIDGAPAVGDGQPGNVYGECVNNPYSCDVVGSFIQRDENDFGMDLNYDGQISSSADVCVGWSYVNSDGWSTLQLLGKNFDIENSMGYLDDGEVPFFKIYDSSSDNIYDLSIDNIYYDEYFEDENQNGTWDEGEFFQDLNENGLWDGTVSGELIGWSMNSIYLYYGYLENDVDGGDDGDADDDGGGDLDIYGCMDNESQNYDPEATIDDGSCIFGPTLISIYDAPDDQGGYVFINWEANSLDVLPNETITHYSIFRYLPNERGWELLDEISANYFSDYGYVAPTIQTSIPEQGLIYETEYFVRAHTLEQSVFYDSDVGFGYSVDNIAPVVPFNFAATHNDDLLEFIWHYEGDLDFSHHSFHSLYNDEISTQDTILQINMTTIYDEHYISTSDIHYNESTSEEYTSVHNFNFGANLITINVLPSNQDLETVFESLGANVHSVVAEGLSSTLTSDGWSGSLTYISPTDAYWVIVNSKDKLILSGARTDCEDLSYNLDIGSNLISFCCKSPISLNLIPNECYSVVGKGVASVYDPALGWIGNLTQLSPGQGYWLTCEENVQLQWDCAE